MALNTWHVALSDPNDPGSDRVLVMTDDEVRDAYPQFAGRAAQFVDRDGIRVSVEARSTDRMSMTLDYLLEMLDSLAHDVENGWPADEVLAHIDMIRAELRRNRTP